MVCDGGAFNLHALVVSFLLGENRVFCTILQLDQA
jgi:hypothetical protein